MANSLIINNINLSPEHSGYVSGAVNHLKSKNLSLGSFPQAMINQLSQEWPSPTLIATFRHCKLDPRPQFIMGDSLVSHISEAGPNSTEVHNLVWETHPKGPDTVKIAHPSQNGAQTTALGRDFPNITQWRPLHEMISELNTSFNHPNWVALTQKLEERLTSAGYSQASGKVTAAISSLENIYRETIDSSKHLTLSQLALALEQTLGLMVLSGVIVHPKAEPVPYSLSLLKNKVIGTLEILDTHIGLESILDLAIDEKTAGNLFAGGNASKSTRVGYSRQKHRFQVSEFSSHNPSLKFRDKKPISKADVFDLLYRGEIVPTGIPTFIALLAASLATPVAHHGNEYGSNPTIIASLGLHDSSGYTQVAPDNSDAWPPIVHQSEKLTFAALYFWQQIFGNDFNQPLQASINQGVPVRI